VGTGGSLTNAEVKTTWIHTLAPPYVFMVRDNFIFIFTFVLQVGFHTETFCCRGYVKDPLGRCVAQCDGGCANGVCTGPNNCTCYPGYTLDRGGNCVVQCPCGCLNGVCAGSLLSPLPSPLHSLHHHGVCAGSLLSLCPLPFIPSNPTESAQVRYCLSALSPPFPSSSRSLRRFATVSLPSPLHSLHHHGVCAGSQHQQCSRPLCQCPLLGLSRTYHLLQSASSFIQLLFSPSIPCDVM
jgi:hypothetical protein